MRSWILAAAAGFTFAFGVTVATRAEANAGQERETFYYSDASFTTQVGYEYSGCETGDRYLQGSQTNYYKVVWSACYPATGSGSFCYACTQDGFCGQVICTV